MYGKFSSKYLLNEETISPLSANFQARAKSESSHDGTLRLGSVAGVLDYSLIDGAPQVEAARRSI